MGNASSDSSIDCGLCTISSFFQPIKSKAKNNKSNRTGQIKGENLGLLISEHKFNPISPFITSERSKDVLKDNAIQRQVSCSPVFRKSKLTIDDFKIIKILGKGTFGTVYLVQKKDDRKYYALKTLDKTDVLLSESISYVLTEKHVLQNSLHPFIVKLRFSFQDQQTLFLVMEYISGGDLYSLLKKKGQFTEDATRLYAAEIILAIEYLHSDMNILYRDLKPENVLIGSDGHIRITDFGLSKSANSPQYSFCGTPEYIAPEILSNVGHTQSVDWWCLGCLVYEMLTGNPPFSCNNRLDLYKAILNNIPVFPQNISKVARDLILRLLEKDPISRLGSKCVEDLKAHPFFNPISWDDLYQKKYKMPYVPTLKCPSKIKIFLEENELKIHDSTVQVQKDCSKHIGGFSYHGSEAEG